MSNNSGAQTFLAVEMEKEVNRNVDLLVLFIRRFSVIFYIVAPKVIQGSSGSDFSWQMEMARHISKAGTILPGHLCNYHFVHGQ